MTFQTSYGTDQAAGTAGMLADFTEPHTRVSGIAEASCGVGLGVIRGTTGRQVKNVAAVTTSATSILATGGASAASPQTLTSGSFNGAIGAGRISPAQQVSLVLSSHANWDATTAIIVGEDADGAPITENLSIPDAGNATVTTVQAFGRVKSVYIPTQSGASGTFTVGTTITAPEYSRSDFLGIAEYQDAHMPYDTATYAGGEYAIGDEVPMISRGRVWAKTEAACLRGDRVFVRITTNGADTVGQFSNVAGAGFALVRGAHFVTAQSSAAGLAQIQL